MHSLVVVAHPDVASLTHGLAREVTTALSDDGRSAELVDLAAEAFDPRFTAADLLHYRGEGPTPPDVVAEQARLDRAQQLVLVFPVYWWSMPALLKGWIDRVFVNGWAFEYSPVGGVLPKLDQLSVHLLAVAGGDADGYERHGYGNALRTQIEHGIFGFCGASIASTRIVHDSETASVEALAAEVSSTAKQVSTLPAVL
ncbi:NAD(P)H-dependent oxidoreductase [Saccharopolyspora sp. WRP15-2]|uniref:NAD(P)H-dependent oxidoreductase n=1 Tax=Saccharopolyspora oryzae TaxID=2997343 RepID=A0ABT4UXC2_9PSEU|nr:NAD(P)H-dependent oxidoreductase [Saccharopolyspora oryzae]MDA3626361.1 NAD(P)H-dependent oxidoreductase [Saccharopolyspora oryzae]